MMTTKIERGGLQLPLTLLSLNTCVLFAHSLDPRQPYAVTGKCLLNSLTMSFLPFNVVSQCLFM